MNGSFDGITLPNDLRDMLAFRGVWILATTRFDKERSRDILTASHLAMCVAYGNRPLWLVTTAKGRFVRFFNHRSEIATAYPDLVWRRKMAEWAFKGINNVPAPARKRMLAEKFKTALPDNEVEG
jgi:hypothetical protein